MNCRQRLRGFAVMKELSLFSKPYSGHSDVVLIDSEYKITRQSVTRFILDKTHEYNKISSFLFMEKWRKGSDLPQQVYETELVWWILNNSKQGKQFQMKSFIYSCRSILGLHILFRLRPFSISSNLPRPVTVNMTNNRLLLV